MQPFIAAFIGESQQYVIVCEGRPLCVIKTLQVALSIVLFRFGIPIPAKNNFVSFKIII